MNRKMASILQVYFRFITSLAYYGLSLGVALLPGSLYVNNLISGAVEIPAYAMSCVLLNKVGRRWPTVATFVLCGIFCILCGPLLDLDCKHTRRLNVNGHSCFRPITCKGLATM